MEQQPPPKNAKLTHWHIVALCSILLLAIFLHFFRIEQEGYGNSYYAAAVKSMLMSNHNFFFVSFDPAGFVSVDKPPLGLWLQTISAWLFGFQGFSLLLPQALAGVLSVLVLYHLVQRVYGPTAGLIAALILTISPISIAANRNNTMDSQLVLVCLLAALAVWKASQLGKLRWLLLCATLLGIGFNIKMLQAYMVLPACFLLYLLAARLPWWRRLLHLSLATLVLLAVSFSWALVVDSIPAEKRPFVGSSQDNSVIELVIGHNGAARLGQIADLIGLDWRQNRLPDSRPSDSQPPLAPGQVAPGPDLRPLNPPTAGLRDETGEPGAWRLFNQQLAGQISWFLPVSLFCSLAIACCQKPNWRLSRGRQALLFWLAWLLPQAAFFSYAGLFHRYYLEMMAPAIAALLGGGLVALWHSYRHAITFRSAGTSRRWWLLDWLLPLALLTALLTQLHILNQYPYWQRWLSYLVSGWAFVFIAGLVILLLGRPKFRQDQTTSIVELVAFARLTAAGAILSLMIAPFVWSLTPLIYGGDSGLPFAGPSLAGRPPNVGIRQTSALTEFLLQTREEETFILATRNARDAAPFILATGQSVMAIGGFSGGDHIITASELALMVVDGQIRFFLLSDQVASGQSIGQAGDPIAWVQINCRAVPRRAWAAPNNQMTLWDCAK